VESNSLCYMKLQFCINWGFLMTCCLRHVDQNLWYEIGGVWLTFTYFVNLIHSYSSMCFIISKPTAALSYSYEIVLFAEIFPTCRL